MTKNYRKLLKITKNTKNKNKIKKKKKKSENKKRGGNLENIREFDLF